VNFYDRFELLGLHRDDGIKTFQAREVLTGRLVQVHLFVHPDAPESVALLKKLDLLPEEERLRIVDRGENQGTLYVVTDRLMDQPGFREWLVAKTKKPAPEAPPQLEKKPLEAAGAWKIVTAPPPAAKSSPEPAKTPAKTIDEEFANLFGTGERPTLPSDPSPPAIAETTLKMPAARPPVAAPAADPGEFTQLFHSGTIAQPEKRDPPRPQPQTQPQPQQPQAPPQPQTPLQPQPQAGEFTRMFQAPATPQAPPHQAPPQAGPPSPQPGEFTRMFQTPSHPAQQPVAAPAGPSASTSKAGEFTRFFETPVAQGPLPQSPAVQQPLAPKVPGSSGPNRVGEFTRQFGAGSVPAASPPTPSAPPPAAGATSAFAVQRPAAPSPGPPIPKGPSEYTQMFARPAPLTLGQPSPQQQQPAQPKPQAAPKSYLPLILGLAAVVLLAVVIVVIFALRSR
jgi:hypothetical protein